MSTKRRAAGAGIKAAFQRQAERAEASVATAAWQPLEVSPPNTPAVPDDYLQEFTAKYDAYTGRRDTIAKLAAKNSSTSNKPGSSAGAAAGAGTRGRLHSTFIDLSGGDPADSDHEEEQQPSTDTSKWQAAAAFCVQQVSMWPGSGVALQQQQIEALLHVVVNNELHPDPLLSSKAYNLLLQNLAAHPPVQLSATAQQPPVLQCIASSGMCWDMFNHQARPLLPDAASPFPLLQQLVSNAVSLVTGGSSNGSISMRRTGGGGGGGGAASGGGAAGGLGCGGVAGAVSGGGGGGVGTSGIGPGAAGAAAGSQGQALLLLYVVQLLQADLLVRQVAFKRYMQLSSTLTNEAQQGEAAARAATALQHSLLYRVMQDDSVGGDSWRYIPGSSKGKHQLVRDLLLLVSCTGHEAHLLQQTSQQQRNTPAPAAAAAAATTPAAAAADGDTEMTEADAGNNTAAAAAASADAAAAAATSSRAAAAAAAADTAVVSQQQQQQAGSPVSSQELIQAARVLLLMMVQLYSSCEEAGVYGRGGEGRHHMQRLQGGAGKPNDRFELEDVMMTAIGSCGHISHLALPHLEQFSRLERLLLTLPVVHRVRLLALMVVSVLNNRVVDPESDGKLAQSAHNLAVEGLKAYLTDRGRGHTGFRQPSAVLVMQSVDARLEWAAKEMFGGKLLFAFLLGNLISAAGGAMQTAPAPDKQAFAEAAGRILKHVMQKQRAAMAADVARWGRCEALCAVTAAKQQLLRLQAS